MIFEFTNVIDYLRPGGMLVADDITENRAFIDFFLAKSGFRSIRLFKTGIAIKVK